MGLVEMALRSGLGCQVSLPDELPPAVELLAESATRVLVVLDAGVNFIEFSGRCADAGLPCQLLGVVSSEPAVEVQGLFTLKVDELRRIHEHTLPAILQGTS